MNISLTLTRDQICSIVSSAIEAKSFNVVQSSFSIFVRLKNDEWVFGARSQLSTNSDDYIFDLLLTHDEIVEIISANLSSTGYNFEDAMIETESARDVNIETSTFCYTIFQVTRTQTDL